MSTVVVLVVLLVFSDWLLVDCIGCFKCTSMNGSHPTCGDPFNPGNDKYMTKCMQGLDGRVGLFPAKYCTKIKAINEKTKAEMLIRSCAMKTLGNTCGLFHLQGQTYNGCLMSCKSNGCNEATSEVPSTSLIYVLLFMIHVCTPWR